MKLFESTVREDFGEYIIGQRLKLTPAKEYPGYYWVIHPITEKPTINAVDNSLLFELEEINQAA